MRLLPIALVAALAVSGCSGTTSDNSSATLDDADTSAAVVDSPTEGASADGDTTGELMTDEVAPTETSPGAVSTEDGAVTAASDDDTSTSGSTASEGAESAGSELVAAGSEVPASDASEAVSSSPVEPGRLPETLPEPLPEPITPVAPQSGILTAGDYDDQLNPGLYQSYARNALQNFSSNMQAPGLDLSSDERVRLVVQDANGTPQARASLQVATIDGETLNLRTAADGTVWLYPSMDRLPATLDISVQNPTGDVQLQDLIDTTALDASRSTVITLPATATPITALDLALIIDTTGSMGDELGYLQAELTDILSALTDANPTVSIRVALVPYRDDGDEYVVRTYPFTSSIVEAQNSLNGESFAGGGDYPEAMDQAMRAMLNLQWRSDAIGVSVLVADAPPHSNRLQDTWQSALAARERMIHIVPVAASGVADEAEYIMRTMAAVTQGRYLFLTDDSGVGNTHAEPTIDCYLVTRLDGLIRRVVQGLLTGERVEPEANEVIREVGNYDNGVCS